MTGTCKTIFQTRDGPSTELGLVQPSVAETRRDDLWPQGLEHPHHVVAIFGFVALGERPGFEREQHRRAADPQRHGFDPQFVQKRPLIEHDLDVTLDKFQAVNAQSGEAAPALLNGLALHPAALRRVVYRHEKFDHHFHAFHAPAPLETGVTALPQSELRKVALEGAIHLAFIAQRSNPQR